METIIESFEVKRLRKLIEGKKAYLQKIDKDKPHAKFLQDEILLLEKDILPLVLEKTTIFHNEISKNVNSILDKVSASNVAGRVNGVLIYYHFNSDFKNDMPFVAFGSNINVIKDINLEMYLMEKETLIYPV